VVLTDVFSVHVINYEGNAWLLSAEISAFFWEKDLLRSQVNIVLANRHHLLSGSDNGLLRGNPNLEAHLLVFRWLRCFCPKYYYL
jgi:hypothetical protein